jgi:hypothetical protein
MNDNILAKLINNLSDRLIQMYQILPIKLRLILLKYLKNTIPHLINQRHHPRLNLQPINRIMYLFTIQPQQLHTTIIINQLKYRKIITTDTFQCLHFIHNDVSKLLVLDLRTNEIRYGDVVVVFYVLFKEFLLGWGLV